MSGFLFCFFYYPLFKNIDVPGKVNWSIPSLTLLSSMVMKKKKGKNAMDKSQHSGPKPVSDLPVVTYISIYTTGQKYQYRLCIKPTGGA